MILRHIKPTDDRALRDLVREVLESFGANREGFAAVDPELDHMSEVYSRPGAVYYVLEMDGQVVGGGGIGPLEGAPPEYCELKKMYFLPEARGKGWGRKMIETCISDAHRMGYRFCYLETLKAMETARFLYADYGFEPREQPFGNTGHGGCDVWMMKTL